MNPLAYVVIRFPLPRGVALRHPVPSVISLTHARMVRCAALGVTEAIASAGKKARPQIQRLQRRDAVLSEQD